ncbi:Hypothetical predicted protein [Paramuricea clavata]|uniref:Uncharacterized protein n=1 Tax=Paramuricea clavata TaxID=317549 RepID=A0A6S7IZ30_PARCT|nr:Hypothetical predicted protein [Paramuricea clavata]
MAVGHVSASSLDNLNFLVNPNSNAKFSTQTAHPVAEPCEKLCEIVADTKAAIEPELYISSHHTCDCNPCGNDIKNAKLDIEDLQKQISSINNVIDSTNGIIKSISEILLPGDGGVLLMIAELRLR